MPVTLWNRGARVEGVTINVGEGGVYFFAAADMAVGDQVEIEFRPPDEKKTVRICGIVRRRALYLYAIEFLPSESSQAQTRVIGADFSDRPASGSA